MSVDESPCVFCALLDGRLSGRWVAREDAAAAFLALPDTSLAPGHTLVVPTTHAVGVYDAEPQDLAAVIMLVGRVARAMRSGLGATGVNVLNASGPGSDQSVPHLHFHVIPRWEGDGFTTWPCLPERSNMSVEGPPEDVLAAALV